MYSFKHTHTHTFADTTNQTHHLTLAIVTFLLSLLKIDEEQEEEEDVSVRSFVRSIARMRRTLIERRIGIPVSVLHFLWEMTFI